MDAALLAMPRSKASRPWHASGTTLDQLAAMMASTTDIVAMTDATFRPTYVNPAGRAFFGLDPETPADQLDLYTGIDPAIRADLRHRVRSALLETGAYRCEYVLTAPHTGRSRRVSATYCVLTSPTGDPLGFAVTCRDVDEAADCPGPDDFVPDHDLIERATLEHELAEFFADPQRFADGRATAIADILAGFAAGAAVVLLAALGRFFILHKKSE